jgi:ATP-dependent DNA helicase RecG
MNLLQNGVLNLAGALLFSKMPHRQLPAFTVKAVAYPGNDIHLDTYIESRDIVGKLETMFDEALAFLLRHLRRLQNGQNVNSEGALEIPRVTLEELLINALVHRDYFISAAIRLFVFDNRIEMISPGHLPNNLTVAHIKNGNSNIRNPILASFAAKILPYRGLGNGIRRALKAYPAIEFEDDREGNLFKVLIMRRADHHEM